MRVAFASYDSANDVGGVSTWLHGLLPRLQAQGFEVEAHLLCFDHHPGVNCAWFEAHRIPCRWRAWPLETSQAVRACLELAAESQPDIYVSNCVLPAYVATRYLRAAGTATVGVFHSDDPFYHGIADAFVGGSGSQAFSGLIAVSEYLATNLRSRTASQSPSVGRIACGVSVTVKAATPPLNRFRLVYVGRLEEEQKRIGAVTRALCAAARTSGEVDAWIVGEGSARPEIEKIIAADSPAPGRVRLLGRVESDRIYDLLRECHALVLLSDFEGLPVSVLEAMAVGVVPICLDMRSGIREVIRSGENGIIVQDRDAGFLSAVSALRADPVLWARLSASARQTVAAGYSIDSTARQWGEFLRSLRRPARHPPFRPPLWIRLPSRDPRFGPTDVRTPMGRRLFAAARQYLGARRRQIQHTFRPSG